MRPLSQMIRPPFKSPLCGSRSKIHYPQGGIAVAVEGDEDIALHLKDTVAAGSRAKLPQIRRTLFSSENI
jgi:aspartate oxidase